MANLTIFGLVQLTSAGADLANDLVPVWDNDALETKKMTLSDLRNLMSPVNWSDSFSSTTQATSSWTPNNAATNINAAILPKGTGAITAAIPDGTTVGGNARGTYAVDFQMSRSAATQVAGGANSFIGGGSSNTASGQYSKVGGGRNNSATNSDSTVSGGRGNSVAALYGTIGGGYLNGTSSGQSGTIAGGESNSLGINAPYATIGGGLSNVIGSGTGLGSYAVIAGGNTNSVFNSNWGVVSGGQSNTASTNSHSSIGGGASNTASGQYSRVAGGQSNTASGQWSTVGGGQTNAASNTHVTVGGGQANNASSSGDTIAGGRSNSTYGSNNSFTKFIGGGESNQVGGDQTSYSGLVCGYQNAITNGRYAFIGGGQSNTINNGGWHCTIGGGQSNYANGNGQIATHATIAGGQSNTTTATFSIITGGSQGVASLYGQQVHASGRFAANGDAQAHELIWRRAITGTAQTELFLDGTSIAAILPGTNSVWNGIIDVTAICTVTGDGTTVVGHVAATSYKVTIKRIGTTTSLVGGVQEIGITNADASMSTSAFTIDNNDTNESLRVQFTPPATAGSTTVIRAIATFRGQQIQY